MAESTEKLQVKIGGMSCSFCTQTIRTGLARNPGVKNVNVSLAHEEALIEYDPAKTTPTALRDIVSSLGYIVRDPNKVRTFEEEEQELAHERYRLVIAGSLTWMSFILMAFIWLGRPLPYMQVIMPALALLTIFGPGGYIVRMAAASLRRRILNQHVLLEFAALAGLVGGFLGLVNPNFPAPDFFAVAVFVSTYHILSGYASLLVRTRSSQAVHKLLSLQPAMARVIRDGREQEIPIAQVQVGDLVRVRPGESIPVDGVVAEGASAIDQSLVTGEPLPEDKTVGDPVIGGSINTSGTLVVRATQVGEQSFLQQVARLIQEARSLKPGIIVLADRILKIYVPAVLSVAALAFLFWSAGQLLLTGQPNWTRAIFAALAALVMGYPCALGMATPLALIRGGGEAARHGILMRSGEAFQTFKDVKRVVLDKTGTITCGKPQVVEVAPLGDHGAREVIAVAATAEFPSEHPLARAVVEYAEREGLEVRPPNEFESVAGSGVRAVSDAVQIRVGNVGFLESEGILTAFARAEIEKREAKSQTVIAVARNRSLMGLIAIADTLKDDAKETIAHLKRIGLQPIMITGDNARTARAVAQAVGIDEVMAEVLPQDKAEQVRRLQAQGYRVAMVGDGINDAPALMQADVGIAIGAGTDIAIESADIILVGDRLSGVVEAYHIAKGSYQKTVQNLALAFSFNGIGVPLAAAGLVHPVWAMIAMVASVSTVLTNSFAGRLIPQVIKQQPQTQVVRLDVPTMHCEGCVANIQSGLERLPGVLAVDTDLDRQNVTVIVRRGEASEANVIERVEQLGHVAGELEAL
jgi:P-type Cu+ transporter